MQTDTQNSKKDLSEVIIETTANFYGMDKQVFKTSKSSKQEDAYRRHICYFMLREYTFMSYDAIAVLFFTRHSTITSGVNKINSLLTYNRRTIVETKKIKKLIDSFKEKLEQQALVN